MSSTNRGGKRLEAIFESLGDKYDEFKRGVV